MGNPVQHFIQSWITWVFTLNIALIFIVRPKFLFSPRRTRKMTREQSRPLIYIFLTVLFFSAALLGSATYFLRLNNLNIVLPQDQTDH